MRLFVAIPLTKFIKEKLCSLHEPMEQVRWLPAGQLHITLQFIGDVSEQQVADLKQSLEKVAQLSFSVFMQGVGTFPKKGEPKVIWIGVQRSESLVELHKAVKQQSEVAGISLKKQTYRPHVTLGRVKGASPKKVQAYKDRHKGWGEQMPVTHFGLYASRLEPEGAVHILLKSYPLKVPENPS